MLVRLSFSTTTRLGNTLLLSPPDGAGSHQSDETGRLEVHVRRFDDPVVQSPISGGTGGSEPRWRADRKVFYRHVGDTRMMAVDIIRAGETFEAGTPRRLFPVSLARTRTKRDTR